MPAQTGIDFNEDMSRKIEALYVTPEVIAAGRGKHFDPDIADAFLQGFDTFVAIARRYQDGA